MKGKRRVPILIIFFSIIILGFFFSIFLESILSFFESSCGDGTTHRMCSEDKPYYCDKGKIIEKASICGCPENTSISLDSCFSKYETHPKKVNFEYVLDGDKRYINVLLYEGVSNYLNSLSPAITYLGGEEPSIRDFKLKKIDDNVQKIYLLPIVVEIQNREKSKINQARIAISLVQRIPYGFSLENLSFFGEEISHSRYPYEVLYDNEGICGEKSELLAFLLREIGYEVVIFRYKEENHEAVGIRCPVEESFKNTGYCFVETTFPSILSSYDYNFLGNLSLNSTPEIIFISDGSSLGKNIDEYSDSEDWFRINKIAEEEGEIWGLNYIKYEKLIEKYGLKEK